MNYLAIIVVFALLSLALYYRYRFNRLSSDNALNKDHALGLDIIDTRVLNKLAGEVSIENLPVLIDAFLRELETRSVAVKTALVNDDQKHLRIEVHSIKSCARTFGATSLATKAADIELSIKEQPDAVAGGIEQMLTDQLPAVKQAFIDYRKALLLH
jgi:HPt (histidine-containing phosphotransfer) domain-containing protein